MRIDRLYLHHVGPFEDLDLEFQPPTQSGKADVQLLVGPNGCGKSTVLYAIAEIVAPDVGPGFLFRRFWDSESEGAVLGGGGVHGVLSGSGPNATPPSTRSPWPEHLTTFEGWQGPVARYRGISSNRDWSTFRAAVGIEPQHLAGRLRPPSAWAAFAYAGVRSTERVTVSAIQESTGNPFSNCLTFVTSANTHAMANWVASQDHKRLKAKDAGRLDRANAIERSIRDIETVISEITDGAFSFYTSADDVNVRAKWNDQVFDFDLLPDGLKSIVSWVADLLMRLDRIPWEGDLLPMQRSFLLLLDEIDIHLHPAWQRKVLPIVQRLFPNAQIIASTHSPFVVASVEDAEIICFAMDKGRSHIKSRTRSHLGASYSAVLRSAFGIDREFDVETEGLFDRFHELRSAVLVGKEDQRQALDQAANELQARGEEVAQLVAVEMAQLRRQLKERSAP